MSGGLGPGYSKRSLVEKLGLKAGQKALLLNPPPGYLEKLGPLPAGLELALDRQGPLDFIQFFTTRYTDLEANFPALKTSLTRQGMLWVSWPKGRIKIAGDLNENQVRSVGLANGLVDVKVIAVDETWSGLKFVYRLTDR
jgi:hypothetical protein